MNERDTPDLPPGTSINGAVVEALVKAGGYGTVYRARDKLSGTLLAIKFIPLYRAEEWAMRESIIAMPLRHENLVQQVGFGYWPHVEPRFIWLKMLYVEGRELDEWAWEENPDARAVVGKVLGVARGLAVVHERKVVHRDVKEANILVRESDGEPVLLDFGAARREGQATITQGMFPPGTPNYRSPEAWHFGVEKWSEPKAHYRPGKADDLYALGVVLYRLLTGRFPFEVAWDDMAGWWLTERSKPEPQPTPIASSSASPALRSLLGQEVAPSWPPPDIERAAAPPPVEKTPAAVASPVTRSKDDALKKQQAPSPQGDKKQKGILSPVARWCLGAAAAANTACPGAQLRPTPKAEPCPAGAKETMTETLGIFIGSTGVVSFTHENPKPITVREGVTSARLIYGGVPEGVLGDRWKLPTGTILSGRLLFGDGRVYVRFTEAQTPTGDTFKVCLEARQAGKPGVLAEPAGGPETAKVFATIGVKAVHRFE